MLKYNSILVRLYRLYNNFIEKKIIDMIFVQNVCVFIRPTITIKAD